MAMHNCVIKEMYNSKGNIHLMNVILSSIWKKNIREKIRISILIVLHVLFEVPYYIVVLIVRMAEGGF